MSCFLSFFTGFHDCVVLEVSSFTFAFSHVYLGRHQNWFSVHISQAFSSNKMQGANNYRSFLTCSSFCRCLRPHKNCQFSLSRSSIWLCFFPTPSCSLKLKQFQALENKQSAFPPTVYWDIWRLSELHLNCCLPLNTNKFRITNHSKIKNSEIIPLLKLCHMKALVLQTAWQPSLLLLRGNSDHIYIYYKPQTQDVFVS